MTKILIVEDDEPKLAQICELLDLYKSVEYRDARSLNSASRLLDSSAYDFIVLDMSLPTFDGGRTGNASGRQKTLGGDHLMMYMKELEIATKVVVLTQWKDFPGEDGLISLASLHLIFSEKFSNLYSGYVHFSHSSDSWKSELICLLDIAQ